MTCLEDEALVEKGCEVMIWCAKSINRYSNIHRQQAHIVLENRMSNNITK